MARYDIIVVGLGAAGAATALQAAKRGARVLGLDRFSPPHDRGSSHGESRITRLAIGEGAEYTPLALRSHEIWREIEKETGTSLLTANGGLIISSAGTSASVHVPGFFANTVAAAERFGIAHELLDARALRKRFPQFRVRDGEFGYFEPEAGFLRPEECVRSELLLAARHGAELHHGETMRRFDASAASVTVVSDKASYEADTLVIAAGPWLPELLPQFVQHFAVRRQVLYWFAIEDDAAQFAPENCPVFIWELPDRKQGIYGFPALASPDGGVKIATEQYVTATAPDAVDRTVSQAETDAMYATYVGPFFPALGRRCIRSATCLYTVTPDAGFVIDRHPDSNRVIVASPCSGHGFKHSAALGEAISEWVLLGRSRLDLAPFRLSRLNGL